MTVIKQNSYLSSDPPAPIPTIIILKTSHIFKWLYICCTEDDIHSFKGLKVNRKEWIYLEPLELL